MRDPAELTSLLVRASLALHLTQAGLGDLLGSSHRTAHRWHVGEAYPSDKQVQELARHVFPADPSIAAGLAEQAGCTLESLGVVRPTPPPAPPPPPRPAPEVMIDSVVCAAAEAIDVVPRDIRPALRAAFARARMLGMSIEEAERALRGAAGPSEIDLGKDKRAARSSARARAS